MKRSVIYALAAPVLAVRRRRGGRRRSRCCAIGDEPGRRRSRRCGQRHRLGRLRRRPSSTGPCRTTCMGLAVAIGFKMGLFNIGVDGQYRMAALLAAAAGAAVTFPALLHVAVHRPGRHRRRRRIRRDRRRPQGDARRERGRLDDHAQLHRHRHHCVPAGRVPACNKAVDLARRDRTTPAASGSLPPLNRFLEVFGYHLPGGRPAGLPGRGGPARHRVLRRRLAHPLRLRPARDGRQPRAAAGAAASTRTR